jgi:hypothetical protein
MSAAAPPAKAGGLKFGGYGGVWGGSTSQGSFEKKFLTEKKSREEYFFQWTTGEATPQAHPHPPNQTGQQGTSMSRLEAREWLADTLGKSGEAAEHVIFSRSGIKPTQSARTGHDPTADA